MNPESLVAPAGCGDRLGGGDSLLLDRDGVGGPLCRCHGSRVSPSVQEDEMKILWVFGSDICCRFEPVGGWGRIEYLKSFGSLEAKL